MESKLTLTDLIATAIVAVAMAGGIMAFGYFNYKAIVLHHLMTKTYSPNKSNSRIEKVANGYIHPSRLEIITADDNGDGIFETYLRLNSSRYFHIKSSPTDPNSIIIIPYQANTH